MSDTAVADVVNDLEPEAQEKVLVLGQGRPDELVFVQKPLTFFGKLRFFAVAGKAIEEAISDGVSISELLEVPEDEEGNKLPLDARSFSEADTFVKAVSKLIQYAPDMVGDLYCVILAVPRGQTEYVKDRLEAELDDEQGIQVIETFIDQNWEPLVDFFSQRIAPLVSQVSQKVQDRDSAQSKPSRATRRSTRKQ